jgi:hypothetical protein
LQTTEEHFEKATKGDCSALQKALHQRAKMTTKGRQEQHPENEKTPENTAFSEVCACPCGR